MDTDRVGARGAELGTAQEPCRSVTSGRTRRVRCVRRAFEHGPASRLPPGAADYKTAQHAIIALREVVRRGEPAAGAG